MHALKYEQIGDNLAIQWDDGTDSVIGLETLRLHCPCAGCKGEVDVLGQLHKGPERPLLPSSFKLMRLVPVGGYALQPVWGDGHSSGIYSFDYLKRVADGGEAE